MDSTWQPSTCWRGGWGRQGRAGPGCRERGGSSPSTAFAITLPVRHTCGDQRCEMECGRMTDRARCPSAARNSTSLKMASSLFPNRFEDMHKGKVLCGLWPGVLTPQVGARAAPSPESSGRSEAGGQPPSLGPQPPDLAVCAAWGLGHAQLPDCPWGLPGEALACASVVAVRSPRSCLTHLGTQPLFHTVVSAHVLRPVSPSQISFPPVQDKKDSPAAVC